MASRIWSSASPTTKVPVKGLMAGRLRPAATRSSPRAVIAGGRASAVSRTRATSKVSNKDVGVCPAARATISSVKGVMFTRPAVVARLCSTTAGEACVTRSMHGRVCPPSSDREKLPSAWVTPETCGPDAHLATKGTLARAAPVAARPCSEGGVSSPPPHATRVRARAMAPAKAALERTAFFILGLAFCRDVQGSVTDLVPPTVTTTLPDAAMPSRPPLPDVLMD